MIKFAAVEECLICVDCGEEIRLNEAGDGLICNCCGKENEFTDTIPIVSKTKD